MKLYEKFMNLFDKPETSKSAETNAKDNQGNELFKIINAVVNESVNILNEPSTNLTPTSVDTLPTVLASIPTFTYEASDSSANSSGPHGENEYENNGNETQSDAQSETEEIFAELIPEYDPNYPPMLKWMRDHPQSQIIGETSTSVLTRAQQKAKQTALFSKVEFCMLNSFIFKIEPKMVNVALDHADWVQAM
ncbi:hypothetical protein L2E82_09982 [Cichorium intybus]|uniref:Uncharacterized protein n=1 Tax=Cichorium intybus TaxID=13427 RepID=A0ACB9GAN0_CICIN|nr:hypothetical protein L2E82_09982 [Cichorium intybus]